MVEPIQSVWVVELDECNQLYQLDHIKEVPCTACCHWPKHARDRGKDNMSNKSYSNCCRCRADYRIIEDAVILPVDSKTLFALAALTSRWAYDAVFNFALVTRNRNGECQFLAQGRFCGYCELSRCNP